MFDNLSERLERSFNILKGEGRITEINIAETVKDIRKALLEAEGDKTKASEFYEKLDPSSEKKYILSAIGSLSVNRYKNYVNNQMIIDDFTISEYKPKTAQNVFGKR